MTREGPPRRGPRPARVHGHVGPDGGGAWLLVYGIVRGIPPGRIMTYGQISGLLGHRLSPVAVGWALHVSPDDVPWHRVVNAQGGCSTARLPHLPPGLQRKFLEAEGVEFRSDGTLDVRRYRFVPAGAGYPDAPGV